MNSIYPNLSAPTAGLATVIYQIKFKNVCKVGKRLVQPGLVWSRTLSIPLSMNGKSVSLPLFA